MIVEIDGVPLHLAHPDELNITWVGQEEVMRQLLAAWLVAVTRPWPKQFERTRLASVPWPSFPYPMLTQPYPNWPTLWTR